MTQMDLRSFQIAPNPRQSQKNLMALEKLDAKHFAPKFDDRVPGWLPSPGFDLNLHFLGLPWLVRPKRGGPDTANHLGNAGANLHSTEVDDDPVAAETVA